MNKLKVKIIFDFDDEADISYTTIKSNLTNEELIKVIDEVDGYLVNDDNDEGKSIYGEIGHNINTLLTEVSKRIKIDYETVLEITVNSFAQVVSEPNYDVELKLW